MPSQEVLNVSSPAPEEDAWVRGPEEDILALHRRPTIPSNTTTQAISRASRSHTSAPRTQTGPRIKESSRVREDGQAASQATPLGRRIVLDKVPSQSQHTNERIVESDRTTAEIAESGIRKTEEAQSSKTRKRPFPKDQGKADSAQHERQVGDSKRRRLNKQTGKVKET